MIPWSKSPFRALDLQPQACSMSPVLAKQPAKYTSQQAGGFPVERREPYIPLAGLVPCPRHILNIDMPGKGSCPLPFLEPQGQDREQDNETHPDSGGSNARLQCSTRLFSLNPTKCITLSLSPFTLKVRRLNLEEHFSTVIRELKFDFYKIKSRLLIFILNYLCST